MTKRIIPSDFVLWLRWFGASYGGHVVSGLPFARFTWPSSSSNWTIKVCYVALKSAIVKAHMPLPSLPQR